MFNRRQAIRVAISCLPLGATACLFSRTQFATDVQLVATGLDAVGKVILALPSLPPSTRNTLNTALPAMNNAAKAISDSATPSVSDEQAFIDLVNAIISVSSALPGLPLPASLGVAAASVLLPIIEEAFHLPAAPTLSATGPGGRLTPSSIMSAGEARNVLSRLASHNQE